MIKDLNYAITYYLSTLLQVIIIAVVVGIIVSLYIVTWNVDPSFLEPMMGPYYEMIERMKRW